jgi:hypothetical protein
MRWAVLASALLVLASATLSDAVAQAQGSRRDSAQRHRQPTANSAPQEQEQTSSQKKLKELDDALAKKLKGICRGC